MAICTAVSSSSRIASCMENKGCCLLLHRGSEVEGQILSALHVWNFFFVYNTLEFPITVNRHKFLDSIKVMFLTQNMYVSSIEEAVEYPGEPAYTSPAFILATLFIYHRPSTFLLE